MKNSGKIKEKMERSREILVGTVSSSNTQDHIMSRTLLTKKKKKQQKKTPNYH